MTSPKLLTLWPRDSVGCDEPRHRTSTRAQRPRLWCDRRSPRAVVNREPLVAGSPKAIFDAARERFPGSRWLSATRSTQTSEAQTDPG
jgi:hypothetical protein